MKINLRVASSDFLLSVEREADFEDALVSVLTAAVSATQQRWHTFWGKLQKRRVFSRRTLTVRLGLHETGSDRLHNIQQKWLLTRQFLRRFGWYLFLFTFIFCLLWQYSFTGFLNLKHRPVIRESSGRINRMQIRRYLHLRTPVWRVVKLQSRRP